MNRTILAMDIGGGTQDILLYDPAEPMENAVKLVLPSPTVIAARRIGRATRAGRAVFLDGRVMGGGAVGRAVRAHLKAGLAVYSLKDPSLTLHDNLDKIRALGVEIVDEAPADSFVGVTLGDLDLVNLANALALFEVTLPDTIALAIQDHGYSPHFSNRLTRFRQWQKFLDQGGDIKDLLFPKAPPELSRWVAASETVPGAYFMDTSAAALRGAVLDDHAASLLEDGLLVINVGNEHTVAFLVRGRRVFAVYEHHTSLLNAEKLAGHMDRFPQGNLPHDEIFAEWGHGVAYHPDMADSGPFRPVIITGPQRELARGLGHMASPYGEMMLSGCYGLVQAVLEHFGNRP